MSCCLVRMLKHRCRFGCVDSLSPTELVLHGPRPDWGLWQELPQDKDRMRPWWGWSGWGRLSGDLWTLLRGYTEICRTSAGMQSPRSFLSPPSLSEFTVLRVSTLLSFVLWWCFFMVCSSLGILTYYFTVQTGHYNPQNFKNNVTALLLLLAVGSS